MKTLNRIIVIDDDLVNNMICRQTIKKTDPELEVKTFDIPEKGFEFIENEYPSCCVETTSILFLDINMPSWTGWEFLEYFEKLDEKVKKMFKIYMLSSSIDVLDEERAFNNKNVVDYLRKPLLKGTLMKILH